MKILTLGSRFFGGQVDRIDKGFIELGHELVQKYADADLVYTNDGGFYGQLVNDKNQGKIKGKIIMNVLDIPEHLFPKVDLNDLKQKLGHADAITSISEYVQWQLDHYLKIKSSIIYQPIKPVSKLVGPERNSLKRFLSVGRRTDPNKRFLLTLSALKLIGVNYDQIGLVGNENHNGGNYFGVLSDEKLNEIYNCVDFVIATGKVEGMNLPVIEAMATGCIPIVCNDMTTRKEFLPVDIFPEYEDVYPNPISISKFVAQFMNDNDAMEKMKNRLLGYYKVILEEKTSPKGVASRIIKTYNSL